MLVSFFSVLPWCAHIVTFWNEYLVSKRAGVFVYGYRRSEGGACHFFENLMATVGR